MARYRVSQCNPDWVYDTKTDTEFSPGNRNHQCIQDYLDWAEAGGVLDPAFTDEELLAQAKAGKIAEINAGFFSKETSPVTVGGHSFVGGKSSALSLKSQYDLVADYVTKNDPSITTVDFLDVNGATVTLPLDSEDEIDGMDVVAQVTMAYSALSFKRAQLLATVAAAATTDAVATISWED